jgi:dCMP deaminase
VNKWDEDYLALAEFWAKRKSKDPSTQTGAIIVRPDKTIVSMGYNGFPSKLNDDATILADREAKYERIIHCEMNAVRTAKEAVEGCTLYTWPFLSCPRCAVHMIAWGITRVVAPKCPDDKLARWGEQLERSKSFFMEAGVEIVEY